MKVAAENKKAFIVPVVFSFLIYLILLTKYGIPSKGAVAILSALIVIPCAWLWKIRGGLICAIILVALNASIFWKLDNAKILDFNLLSILLGNSMLLFIGFIIGYLSHLRAQSRRLIADLTISQNKLELKNREILDYADSITHDIKKPLSTLTTVCELMQNPELLRNHAKLSETIGLGKKSLLYVQSLLEDLMESARLDAGTSTLNRERFPVADVVTPVLERLQPEFALKKIEVISQCDCIVFADRVGMEKIFMNLIGNAINYIGTTPGPEIAVRSQLQENGCLISVSDNGIGISAASQITIFEKFKRGDNVRGTSGTGLGLYIAKSIVKSHGGRMWVESKEGSGSTFNFTIPG